MVGVDQGEPAYTAARQSLDCPGAHAADADYADMGAGEAGQSLFAIDAGDTTETPGTDCTIIGHGCFDNELKSRF